MNCYSTPKFSLPVLVNLKPRYVDLDENPFAASAKTWVSIPLKTAKSMPESAAALESFTYCRFFEQTLQKYADFGPKRRANYQKLFQALADSRPLPNFEFLLVPARVAPRFNHPSPKAPVPVFVPGGKGISSPFFSIPTVEEANLVLLSTGAAKESPSSSEESWTYRKREVIEAARFGSRMHRQTISFRYVLVRAGEISGYELLQWMRSGTTVVLDGTLDRWHASIFTPWDDYVPFSELGISKKRIIDWCRSNDEKCRSIATQGSKTAWNVNASTIFDYLQSLIVVLDRASQRNYFYPSLSDEEWMESMLREWYDGARNAVVESSNPEFFWTQDPDRLRFPPFRRTAGYLRAASFIAKRIDPEYLPPSSGSLGNLTVSRKGASLHEAFVSLEIANAMFPHTPNFVFSYAYLPDGILLQEKFLESLPTLDVWLRRGGPPHVFAELLFQLAMSLELAQKKFAFTHGSLTPESIYVWEPPVAVDIDYHPKLFETYTLRKTRVVPLIAHFEKSRVVLNHTHFTPNGTLRRADFGEDLCSLLKNLIVYFPKALRALHLPTPSFGMGMDGLDTAPVLPGDLIRYLIGSGLSIETVGEDVETVRCRFTDGDHHAQILHETFAATANPANVITPEVKGESLNRLFRDFASTSLPPPSADPLTQNFLHAMAVSVMENLYAYFVRIGSPSNAQEAAFSVKEFAKILYARSQNPLSESKSVQSIPDAIQKISAIAASSAIIGRHSLDSPVPTGPIYSPSVIDEAGKNYEKLVRLSESYDVLVSTFAAPPTIHLNFADTTTYLQKAVATMQSNLEDPLLHDWSERFEQNLRKLDEIYF